MSIVLVNSKTITPASQIIDLLNGKHIFCVENPYFRINGITKPKLNEFLTYKQIDNGTQIVAPKIYYKHVDLYTTNFKLNLFEHPKLCRLFGPYSKTGESLKPKSNNKFMLSFGKYDETDSEIHSILLLHQQLAFALEFLLIAKLLDIEITNEDTDEIFVKKVIKLIKVDESDENVEKLLKILKDNELCTTVKENETSESVCGFFDRFKAEIAQYCKKHSKKENSIIKFYGGKSDGLYNSVSAKPVFIITETIKHEKDKSEPTKFVCVNSKFNFVLKLDGGKNDYFATKIIKDRKARPLGHTEYMNYVKENSKYECKFIVGVSYDIRKYGSGPLICTKIDVNECIIKTPKLSSVASFLLDDCEDDEQEEIQTTIDGDSNLDNYLA